MGKIIHRNITGKFSQIFVVSHAHGSATIDGGCLSTKKRFMDCQRCSEIFPMSLEQGALMLYISIIDKYKFQVREANLYARFDLLLHKRVVGVQVKSPVRKIGCFDGRYKSSLLHPLHGAAQHTTSMNRIRKEVKNKRGSSLSHQRIDTRAHCQTDPHTRSVLTPHPPTSGNLQCCLFLRFADRPETIQCTQRRTKLVHRDQDTMLLPKR